MVKRMDNIASFRRDISGGESARVSKTKALRNLLTSQDLTFLTEAHSALSAMIVEEAGFQGIWASGLGMSSALGVRDRNEASWSQLVDVLEFMADATSVPILMDGDTGFGDFNNARRLVVKLCQRGIAGVCLEDKEFPKSNSLLNKSGSLADPAAFCGKIAACKDAQTDDDFVVVARVEALVAGLPMSEAVRRAEAYCKAGADAIVIHSKQKTADEVIEFARCWSGQRPLVVIPTTYFSEPVETYRQAGISSVIWANHSVRASIAAMRKICRNLHQIEGRVQSELDLPTVADLFRFLGEEEFNEAERHYNGSAFAALLEQ